MRTTLDIDEVLLREAKKQAVEEGKTLTRIIEEGLRLRLIPAQKRDKPFKLRLLTFKSGLLPGVDLEDRDSLYEIMEGRR